MVARREALYRWSHGLPITSHLGKGWPENLTLRMAVRIAERSAMGHQLPKGSTIVL